MENQKHFIVIDPNCNAELLKHLRWFFAPNTTSIALNGPVVFQGGFATIEPYYGTLGNFAGVLLDGTLRIPSDVVLMAGSSSDSELGFRCAE